MEITTRLGDNKFWITQDAPLSNLVYGDCIYESLDFEWAKLAYDNLVEGGIFIVQTDYHTQYKYRNFLQHYLGGYFVNHAVWKNEWGNHPKDRLHQCYDDILIYSKGKNYKFYPERIQIPKATANTKLNPSGRITKTATAWIDDIILTTTAKERVKVNGKNIRWQKPLALLDRLLLPFTDEGDNILDPFLGSGTTAIWCLKNNRNFFGIENNEEIYQIALDRINEWQK